jgi:UDP-2,3-diacylglucosamine hydrolase
LARPIGILAGNGSLPREIAMAARARGQGVHIVTLTGEVDPGLAEFSPRRLGWGQIGGLLQGLKAANCHELIIVGGVTRPDLGTIRPDWGLIANLPQMVRLVLSGGDDGVLRAMIRFLESKGFCVVSPAAVAPGLLVGAGAMGQFEPAPTDAADMIFGSSVVRALGAYDIGQAVIVRDGVIEAIEAVEGTDRMIARVIALRQSAGETGVKRGVLVKRPKPNQEMRIDLPTIGPNTVALATQAGLAGIAVLAGQTLAAERAQLERAADQAGLFVYGFSARDEAVRSARAEGIGALEVRRLGRVHPTSLQRDDSVLGARVLSSLAALSDTGIAVVHRGHVLAVEPRGGNTQALARVAQLRQWGEGRWTRRAGVAVLGEGLVLSTDILAAVNASNLAGVAQIGARDGSLRDDARRVADQQGVFVASVTLGRVVLGVEALPRRAL